MRVRGGGASVYRYTGARGGHYNVGTEKYMESNVYALEARLPPTRI